MTAPTLLFPAAPARTGRQVTALHAAVTLLERLVTIAALNLTIPVDFAPGLPVRVDAQISTTGLDPGPRDAARFDRLNAAAVALDAPIVHEWTGEGRSVFALTGVVINGVPIHLWAAFTDPDVIVRAHALCALDRTPTHPDGRTAL